MSIVKHTKIYNVIETVVYYDNQLGEIIIEKGDQLIELADEPGVYSNGLALVTQANIDCRVPQFFQLITPVITIEAPKKKRKFTLKNLK